MDIKFKNPAYPSKVINISGKIKEKHQSVNTVILELEAKYLNKKIIASGYVTVKLL